MSIHDFELYHGAVLTTLVRSDRPVTLRTIETNASDCWSAYILDDAFVIYTKRSGHGDWNEDTRSVKWTFTFQPEHLNELGRFEAEHHNVSMALVCANHDLRNPDPLIIPGDPCTWKEANADWTAWFKNWFEKERQLREQTGICFLEPHIWHECLDLKSGGTQSIRVDLAQGKSFLVNKDLWVSRNRLNTWASHQRMLAEIPD